MPSPGNVKKRQPFSKTVVTEFKIQLADVLSRSIRLQGSQASAIPETQPFNSGDANISDALPLIVKDAKSLCIINSYEAFNVELYHTVTVYPPPPGPDDLVNQDGQLVDSDGNVIPQPPPVTTVNVVKLACEGLFLVHSPAEKIVVTPRTSGSQIRVQYIWS